jgi:hypothetical protein
MEYFDYHTAIENIMNATEPEDAKEDIHDLIMYIETLQDTINSLQYDKCNLESENNDLNTLVAELQNE